MKKRTVCLALVFILCLSLLAACGGGSSAPAASSAPGGSSSAPAESSAPAPAADEKPVTLLMGHGFSENGNTKTAVWADIADKVNELSGGSLTIEQAFDGTICDDAGILDAVMTDVTQLGPQPFTYMTGMIPELSVMCIPGWFNGTEEDYIQFDKEIFDVMSRIFEKYGLKYIAGDYPGQSAFFGNGEPVLTLDAFKGKMMRVSGTDQIKAVEAWGGAATIIPLPDLTTALDRGTVDGAMSGYQLIHVFSFDEIIDYAVILPTYEPAHGFYVTMDTWNSLSAAQQDALMKGFEDVTEVTFAKSDELEYGPYLQEYRDEGVDVYEPTKEDFQPFVDLLKPNFDALKQGNSEEGLELMKIVYKYNGWDWED